MWSKLRKFGLDHCDLPTMVENSSELLRVLSLNLDPSYDKKIPKLFNIFTIVIFLCYVYVCVVSMLWYVFWRCVETGDVISAMVIFSLGICSEISTVKFVYTFLYQKSLRNLIRDYLSYDSKAAPNSRFKINVLKVLRQVKKRAIIFWSIVVGDSLIYWIKPLLMPGRHLIEDTEYLYGLEPLFESPNFEIAYFVSLCASMFTVYATANISVFLITVTGYIEAQMLALGEELLNIWDDAQDYYEKYDVIEHKFEDNNENAKDKHIITNRYVKNQLRTIVDKHTSNIRFLSQIENVFRSSIAIEFGLLMISLIAEFLGGIENTYLLIPFALVQVTMDCITGQKLLDSSKVFQRAVFESKWENFDLDNMKTVLIILVNSQRDMALTVGGLKTLSLLCLMDVFRKIYSTYAALSTMVHS
ncbi:uncharacterized protein LOC106134397 [Amyelois transitella]|uniref:uncharacterized protein LOC106134397 n=1 Tax=Amyelois transitella TaxID=680683 RepID=UPI00298FFF39|nr:uncharacterized protein LOC106134397 [Amyelois transitella]